MHQKPIAIVGVSALFPGSTDVSGFWRDILEGRDLTSEVPNSHWRIEDYYDPDPTAPDKTYSKRGAFLPDVSFAPMDFGVPPSIMPATDTAQLLALIVAQQVLEDVGPAFRSIDREKTSVILGVTSGQELLGAMVSRLQRPVWAKALREAGVPDAQAQAICERISAHYVPWQEASFPGLLGNVVAGRIANRFDLHGTNCVTDAACASALSAVSMAVNELQVGQSDLVITGGVDTMNDILMYVCFSKTPALSPTGDCRPFSEAADGTLLGEGIGMLALRRLEDAERDGNRIYAVLRGVGTSSDGRSKSVYAPLPEGQARALRRAYEIAGYGPETVELVEAHGTATKAGDIAEFEGLRQVFAEARPDHGWCALGSVKSQIGHTKAAAGVAGLVKAVLALHHKVLPPTIKVSAPNSKLGIADSPFYLNTRARPWIHAPALPRRASVSSFGFGGSNFHVALEEYTGSAEQPARLRTERSELYLLAADSVEQLRALCSARAEALTGQPLAAAAQSSQQAFDPKQAARLAIVAESSEELAQKLQLAEQQLRAAGPEGFSTPNGIHCETTPADARGVAFLFPGQGSQYVGMGAQLAMQLDAARSVWDQAAAHVFDGRRVHELVFARPTFTPAEEAEQAAQLTATEWAQPALGMASAATLAVLHQLGVRAECVAGHSFGELTALYAAGVYDLPTLLHCARRRGELMRDASTTAGAMLAVALPYDKVQALLAQRGGDLVIANHNHPNQVVVSGARPAIEALSDALAAQDVQARVLPVSTAFHSPLVSGASALLAQHFAEVPFAAPSLPVYANSSGAPYRGDVAAMRAQLAEQLAQPVRFVDMVRAMWDAGARTFVEVGPGSVLSEFVQRTLHGRPHRAITTERKGRNAYTGLLEAVGRLAVAGLELDYSPLWAAALRTPPQPKSALAVPINGANYGKLYPSGAAAPGQASSPTKPAPKPVEQAPRSAATRSHNDNSKPTNGSAAHSVTVAEPARSAPVSYVAELAPIQERPAPTPATPPPTAAAPAHAATAPEAQPAYLEVFQQAQRALIDAQSAYQRSMAESHLAFLRATETSNQLLYAMLSGGAPPLPAPVELSPRAAALAATADVLVPAPAPVPAQVLEPARAVVQTTSAAQPAAAATSHHAPDTAALERVMLQVVADKTGYPVDMLTLSMELEADLGVDSIKRVEILAALRERVQTLPEFAPTELAALRSLGEIVSYLRGQASEPAASHLASQPPAADSGASLSSTELEQLMLQVVAEKTGYPVDMLTLGMELEADLGVDSIKRVEILAAMRQRAPQLPEFVASDLATLRSLGEITQYMRAQLPAQGATSAAAPMPLSASAPTTAPAPSSADLERLMLQVVAEKTGYPVEMLALSMELEADLGIDSIKRVEILAAMRQRAPQLPEFAAADLAALRSLGEITAYMREHTAHAQSGAAPRAHAQAPAISPEAQSRAETTAISGITRRVLRCLPDPAPGFMLAGLASARRIVVTDDGAGVGRALVELLRRRGQKAELCSAVTGDADAVIFLGGLSEVADESAAIAQNAAAFAAAQSVAARFARDGGVFVTVQDTGADFGLSGRDPVRAWLAGIAALTRTAALEWPQAHVTCLDVERAGRPPAAIAAAILHELDHGAGQRDVGLCADGTRLRLHALPSVLPSQVSDAALPFDERSFIVVSGGARGVTSAALRALLARTRARVLLLGRTPLQAEPSCCAGAHSDAELKHALLGELRAAGQSVTPAQLGAQVASIQANREIQATLDALVAAGGKAHYAAVDVQSGSALHNLLHKAREQWGPITGLVHAAGVLADKLIADKTPAQFASVFDTKVRGLAALLAATANDPLQAIVVFSSVAARTGNPGQSDYGMANEVLNAVAAAEQQRRGDACVVKAIGWGPWESGMVTPALKALFEQRHIPLISLTEGAARFVAELCGPKDEVVSVIGADLEAKAQRQWSCELALSSAHPYLRDHAIAGVVVVPMACVLEWMVRFAQSVRPGQHCSEVEALEVVQGIKLSAIGPQVDRFVLTLSEHDEEGLLSAELRAAASGRLHYRAQLAYRADRAPATAVPPTVQTLNAAGPEPIYDGVTLFHGPAFRTLVEVAGFGELAAEATLRDMTALGWPASTSGIDPVAVDGALQLAVLWSAHVLGGDTLPMHIAAFRRYDEVPPLGELRALLLGREVQTTHTRCDVALYNDAGELVAELLGIHCYARGTQSATATRQAYAV